MTATVLDVTGLRSETPLCSLLTHLNHAGASPAPMSVLNSVTQHLQREAMYGPMEVGAQAAELVASTRAAAGSLLGASPDEIAFTASGSEAWGRAFAALPPLKSGDRILVGAHEWGGNLATLQRAADRVGAQVEVIPSDDSGAVCADGLANMIDGNVRLIALTWLPANGGLINPAAAIGRVARAANIPYFVDAGQALGQLPIDVKAIGCDVLKGAGRKYLRGPRGTAILYVRREFIQTLEPAYLDVLSAPWSEDGPKLRTDARRFETSEMPVALMLGLGEAIRVALDLGLETIRTTIDGIARMTRDRLSAIPGVDIRDLGHPEQRSGLVSFTVDGLAASELRTLLAGKCISIGANGVAYTPIDMRARGISEIARASVSYFTTPDEIELLGRAVEILAGLHSTTARSSAPMMLPQEGLS